MHRKGKNLWLGIGILQLGMYNMVTYIIFEVYVLIVTFPVMSYVGMREGAGQLLKSRNKYNNFYQL